MTHKRLTLFAGHYGSGKTNIALNYARWLRRKGEAVTVADLDIVNPYFRTKDSEEDLKKEGIGLIVSPFANSNLDVPAMPKETYALIAERGECGVLDIGGDDRGALALGRYVPEIRAEGDYEMLFVINRARPLIRSLCCGKSRPPVGCRLRQSSTIRISGRRRRRRMCCQVCPMRKRSPRGQGCRSR